VFLFYPVLGFLNMIFKIKPGNERRRERSCVGYPNLSEKAQKIMLWLEVPLTRLTRKHYAELMSRYKDSIYFMLLKMVNNRDDADD